LSCNAVSEASYIFLAKPELCSDSLFRKPRSASSPRAKLNIAASGSKFNSLTVAWILSGRTSPTVGSPSVRNKIMGSGFSLIVIFCSPSCATRIAVLRVSSMLVPDEQRRCYSINCFGPQPILIFFQLRYLSVVDRTYQDQRSCKLIDFIADIDHSVKQAAHLQIYPISMNV